MSLTGNLADFGVGELLQILSMGRKTGILAVEGDLHSGELVLWGGRLVHATEAAAVGEEAFYRLMSNRAGRFIFTTTPVDEEVAARAVTIQRKLDVLLLEATQRLR